jgi:hypothetical protein
MMKRSGLRADQFAPGAHKNGIATKPLSAQAAALEQKSSK